MSESTIVMLIGVLAAVTVKLVCFAFGYGIVRLGAGLLREGVTGSFKFNTEIHGVKADLASASPGLLFVLLGVLLIGYAMWLPKSFAWAKPPAVAEAPPAGLVPQAGER